MNCARFLGLFNIDKMYKLTPREYMNLIKGSQLRMVDEQERNIQAAWVSGNASIPRSKGKKIPKPKDYYDADKIRDEILYGKQEKPKADFTYFDRMQADLKTFKWKDKFKESK